MLKTAPDLPSNNQVSRILRRVGLGNEAGSVGRSGPALALSLYAARISSP